MGIIIIETWANSIYTCMYQHIIILLYNAIRYGSILEQIQKQAQKGMVHVAITSVIVTFTIMTFTSSSYW